MTYWVDLTNRWTIIYNNYNPIISTINFWADFQADYFDLSKREFPYKMQKGIKSAAKIEAGAQEIFMKLRLFEKDHEKILYWEELAPEVRHKYREEYYSSHYDLPMRIKHSSVARKVEKNIDALAFEMEFQEEASPEETRTTASLLDRDIVKGKIL